MRTQNIPILILLLSVAIWSTGCLKEESEALRIVSKHKIQYNAPPKRIPTNVATDAPLMGNGFMSAAISGGPEKQTFYICRNDFWRLKSALDESFPAILGKIELSMPALDGATYHLEQQLSDATTTATFRKGEQTVRYRAYTAATQDLLIVELSLEGKGEISGSVALKQRGEQELAGNALRSNDFPSKMQSGETLQGAVFLSRAFTKEVDIPTMAAVGLRMFGGAANQFTLKEGAPVRFVAATSSNFKSEDCLQHVIDQCTTLTDADIDRIEQSHAEWWTKYWEQSYVSIPDSVVEKHYYVSLYGMGSCSRDADFPPSIFGGWITQEVPAWNGDYHLNYNHMAPYYALYGANRIEQAAPYSNSMIPQIERGKYYSEKICGIKDGIMLPVGAGPLGIETTRRTPFMDQNMQGLLSSGNIEDEGMFWGQKSNSAYAVPNMARHFRYTLDSAYTQKVYPYIKAVATFWEGYLTREGERYVIYNDAIHEGTIGTMNPILSLGLVRLVMQTASQMSNFLGVDADKRAVWDEIETHISDYPTQQRNGKTVFRYTEEGTDWWGDNSLGIQHIYPAEQIGLDSPAELLEISRNTITELWRWRDFNGTNSFFPAAVRVGYNADTILNKLREYALHIYPNGFQYDNPHGIENFSTTPNTINEMLCSGHQGVLRLFPVWNSANDAHFHNIRIEGAFLVSGAIKNGEVEPIRILSEKGSALTLQNPWTASGTSNMKITASDGTVTFKDGERVTIPTQADMSYTIEPAR